MQDNEKESRADGYKNLMNKYGTQDDVSEQYRFESDDPVTDVELTLNYEENGLFAKIIDIPSDDAVSSGFEYGVNDVDLETFINDSLDELDFEGAASTAIKWSRLYGGSLMVMIIDDGKQIDEPVDWDNIRGIDELLQNLRVLRQANLEALINPEALVSRVVERRALYYITSGKKQDFCRRWVNAIYYSSGYLITIWKRFYKPEDK